MKRSMPLPRLPRLGTWLVELFASAEQAESIPGDFHEEFSDLVSKCGVVSARSWYLRQSLKTVAHLFGSAFRPAPGRIAVAVFLGVALHRRSHRSKIQMAPCAPTFTCLTLFRRTQRELPPYETSRRAVCSLTEGLELFPSHL